MVSPVTLLLRSALALCFLPAISLASECFPSPDSDKPQYVVAYGQYLYKETRKNSPVQMMKDTPVWVEGYQRGWFSQRPVLTIPMTELGVVKAPGERFNAVVVSLKSGQVTSLDRDERTLCRIKLAAKNLVPMTSANIKDDGEFWIYATRPKQKQDAIANYPIYQSEVDKFLTGCLEQTRRFKLPDFADQCMQTTYGWNSSWVNDRKRPVQAQLVQVKREEIDKLLMKYQKEYFAPIRIK